MKTRIYTITNNETGTVRLVRASNASAATAHVAKGLLSCIVTDTDSGIVHAKRGIEVETAGEVAEPVSVD